MNIDLNLVIIAVVPAVAYIASMGVFTRLNTKAIDRLESKIDKVDSGLHAEMASMKAELNGRIDKVETQMSSMKTELNGRIDKVETQMSSMKTELNGQMSSMKAELNGRIDKVETQMSSMKTELNGRIDKVETQMSDMKAELNGRIDKVETRMLMDHDTLARMEEKLNIHMNLAPAPQSEAA